MRIVHESGTTARRMLAAVLVPLGLVGASLVVGASAPAQACSCVALDLPSLAKQADAVFVGTPVSTGVEDGERTYEVRVSDVYKGGAGPTTTVTTERQESACGADLELDKQYLVIGDRGSADGTITTSACSGTQPVSDGVLADVEKAFGPATPYRGPRGDTGDGPDRGDDASDNAEHKNAGDTGNGGDGTPANASDTSDDGPDASYVVIGGVLVLALGASFLVPKLRRRNRPEA